MAVQPFDIEGQLPVEIDDIEAVTVENFSVRENKPLTPKGSAKGITGIAEGIPVPTFSFRLPILATKQMTELNLQRFMRAVPSSAKGRRFRFAFKNSVGGRKVLIGSKISMRSYSNTPMQGEAAAEVEGTAEELLDT